MTGTSGRWPRSERKALLTCLLISGVLWCFQQFSEEYIQWTNHPLFISRKDPKGDIIKFPAGKLRIKIRQSGWGWIVNNRAFSKQLDIRWDELVSTGWDRAVISDLIYTKMDFDQDKVLEVEGIQSFLDFSNFGIKSLPIRLDLRGAIVPEGYALKSSPILFPDSVFAFGPLSILSSLHEWPVSLEEGTRVDSDTPLDISFSTLAPATGVLISSNKVRYFPALDPLTEKRWSIRLEFADSTSKVFAVIPSTVEVVATLPMEKFDDDSIHLIKAQIYDPESGDIQEGIQSVRLYPIPSFLLSYRISPPIVSVFEIE